MRSTHCARRARPRRSSPARGRRPWGCSRTLPLPTERPEHCGRGSRRCSARGWMVAGERQGATSISVTIAVVWLGAFAGDSTSFLIGRRLGRGFALHRGARLGVTPERLATVERYFERYGGRTIVIGRFIGLVRALAPFIAG